MKLLLMLSAVSAATAVAITSRQTETTKYSTLLSDSFIARGVNKTNHYTESVFYRGIELAYNATQNETYAAFVKSQIDAVVSSDGVIALYPSYPFSLDDVRIGTILLDLYALTLEPQYKTAAATLRAQLDRGPRTPSGGFWHRQPTYPNQMWLDGIFMADVFYAQWTSLFDSSNITAWDDILLQFSLIEKHCRNSTTNLLVHGYDESFVAVWADPVTGASPNVWDRAPSGRAQLLDWFVSASAGVLAAQDETGGWWLVMNEPYPGMKGNYIESSGSAMFVYAILKGVRLGYLGSEYVPPMKKGYEYLADTFVAYNGTGGTVNWEGTDSGAGLGSNATFEYYISGIIDENDLKGAGPFIYASVEYEQLA